MKTPGMIVSLLFAALLAMGPAARAADDPECKNHYILKCPVPIARWESTGPMAVAPGTGSAAAALADGRVLVTGGLSAPARAQLFDPATRTWSAAPDMHGFRAFHRSVRLRDGRILVVGGDQPMQATTPWTNVPATAELYDPATNAWTWTSPLAARHATFILHDLTATLLNDGTVLVAGGNEIEWDGSRASETYDPATDRWTLAAPMLRGRVGHTATLLEDGTVVVAGGVTDWDFRFFVDKSERYDPATRTWLTIDDTPYASGQSATLLLDGRILATGGQSATPASGPRVPPGAYWPSGSSPGVNAFDPATNRWSYLPAMFDARHDHLSVTFASGEVLVLGGLEASMSTGRFTQVPVTVIEAFDPQATAWRVVAESGASPSEPQSAIPLRDGTVLVVGIDSAAILSYQAGTFSKPRRLWR